MKGSSAQLERMAPNLAKLAAAVPDPMGGLRGLARFLETHHAAGTVLAMLADDETMATVLVSLLGRGAYLSDMLLTHPEAFVPLFVAQDVSEGPEAVEQAVLEAASSLDGDIALRELRRQKTILELQIALEEIYRRGEPESAWRLTAALARGCAIAVARLAARDADLDPEAFGILLLGSAGNGEPVLNSDLDLVFLHDDADLAGRVTRAAQRTGRELERRTADGLLFRIDQRLRLYGQQGVLAASLGSARDFYASKAPVTTRLALVRMRALGGAPAASLVKELPEILYARGFGLDDWKELRAIRDQIVAQVPPGCFDVKSSPGTLSDIEFAAAAAQLERGADNPALRETNTRAAIGALAAAGHWSADDARVLTDAQRFFKVVESCLRTLYPRPVSQLPANDHEAHILARMAGFENFGQVTDRAAEHTAAVLRIVDRSDLRRNDA
ncbi:MAG: DUF294 nucleotidyltransferase-like domain-containing protein [Deltaproteobacteria bacterium]|nr:DUF294 nucleotidyltransferase-like domain-containing protein [Deltaproteobacteria bacterium]